MRKEDYAQLSDKELVEAIKKDRHNNDIWEVLLERFHPNIDSQIRRSKWGFTEQERDDAMQEIHFALLKAIPKFRGRNKKGTKCKLSTYIIQVASNQCHKLSKKISRRRKKESESPTSEDPPSRMPVIEKEYEQIMRQVWAQLKADEQTILYLHYVKGISYDEIATALSLRPATVRKKAQRARDRIAAALKRQGISLREALIGFRKFFGKM
jgi:RNA polymerase sigma factor (sigma-70 family)